MNKTRVDDMLIEMIKPKIEEIEQKFSNNQPLTQDDINTLLLKSQYNHINHLDDKLNETVESVRNLENKFLVLEGKFLNLEVRFENLEKRFENLEDKFEHLSKEIDLKFEKLDETMKKTIQEALNKNMLSLIAILGFFFTLLKIIDIFAK